ncbi:hypothetical protein AB5I41_19005 [Sphingomonas sp. MMS24-JH45]
MYPIIKTAFVAPDSDVGGRPGISDDIVALERGRKLRRFGKSRIEASIAIHPEYFGALARYEDNGNAKRSQLGYLSKLLK